jgi:predicted NBD/HSP70 family sugar kinase
MKMLGMIVVLALAGAAFADDCCSAEDRKELGYLWKRVWATSFTDRKVAIAGAVFDDLYHRFPEAKELFKRVHVDDKNSGEYRAHLVRVTNGLDTIINLLAEPQVLANQLEHLAGQHIARAGVKKAYFDGIADSFEKILPQVSTCFNVEAFHRCFRKAIGVIAAKLP